MVTGDSIGKTLTLTMLSCSSPRRCRQLRRFLGLAVMVVGIMAGCGDGEKQDSGGPKPEPEAQSQSHGQKASNAATETMENVVSPVPLPPTPENREAVLSLNALGLEDDFEASPWRAEVFNEQASEQLNRLKAFLKDRGGDFPPDLVVASFAATPLRPPSLETVFDDERFLIQRGVPGSEEEQEQVSGVGVFGDLVARFEPGTVRAEFKIFEVQADTGPLRSRMRASLAGRTEEGLVQETSVWTCVWEPGEVPLLRSIAVSAFESSLARNGAEGQSAFTDCTAGVFHGVSAYEDQLVYGIDHWVERIEAAFGINVSGWEGLAVGDANGDGLDDVYLCQPGGLPNRLFIQKADGTVFDASSFAGVDWRIQTQSALFIDLDNDGDQDLALATTLGVILMANDGRATFDVKASLLIPEAAPLGLSAADYDLDGDLDLYAACYSRRRASVKSAVLGRPMPYHDANNGGRNVLLRNDRNWTFTNATLELGLDENNRRFSFASSWEDYDGDGDLDLYVANDYGRNNLYRNDRSASGEHSFVDVAREAGVEDISAGMSVSWGDYNLDGLPDLYVSNMWSSAGHRVSYQRQFHSGASGTVLAEMRRHARGNSLFMNAGDGTFRDVSLEQGVTMGRWAWGSSFVDLNTDGWDDLLVVNGFITQPDDTGDL